MYVSRHLNYGILLLEHRRFSDAEKELRRELAESPENAFAHAMLAIALSAQDKNSEAIGEARRSIGLAPDHPRGYYVLAMALHNASHHREALAAIEDALRLDAENEDHFELQGKIYGALGEWERALQSARQGLACDPQDVACANLEAMALVHLGRQNEATSVIVTALHRDPQNASTHASLGYAALHAGKYPEAVQHFREALRLNPNMEYSRQGIIEAMKARNILYQPILRYFLWMERLPSNVRWGLILGLWVFTRLLRSAAQIEPALAPLVMPLLMVYLVFAFMSWIARPLFNLFLRLDPLGRLALSKDELRASNWLGLCVFGGLGLIAASLFIHIGALSLAGMGLLALSIPVAGIFQARYRKGRLVSALYTGALALIGLLALGAGFVNAEAGSMLNMVFILGWVLYSWIGNFLLKLD